MTIPPRKKPDATKLLEEFLSFGRSDQAFSRLTEELAPLVFSSALRRTGDPHLAEDVTQNVFALLARKAPSLRNHPSLLAWIFQTTRFEAANATRSESRRQNALKAFAEEANVHFTQDLSPDEVAAWKEALPVLDQSLDRLNDKDRQLVLERFYQQRTFAEIATQTGSTEAACKMRLKRALGKLSRLLHKRGITLSAATIASSLSAELVRAAPNAVSLIAPKALAASASVSTSSLILNTYRQ